MFGRAFVLTLALGCPVWAHAAENPYLSELIQQARALHLAEDVVWHKLLHYKPRPILPGVRSLADAPGFFNAPDGKTNPQSELEATLENFFSTIRETDSRQNPQCAFIARYGWLNEKLRFDPARLPPQPCKRFNDWHAVLNPQGVTLIFPAAYLNNPASMYGHTLLRIDAKDQDEKTRLLAYSVNYAANTDETNGLIFAAKGLLGGYPGQFTIAPYYLKVREYNDVENRDIWEYQLELAPEELDRVLRHLWELGPVYFDYYFFDENCSYHLLALLEVARPGLNLTDDFYWWTIPSDTVRTVTAQAGLLRRAVYRPAGVTAMRHRMRLLDQPKRHIAKDLALQRIKLTDASIQQLSVRDQAAVIELAYEYAMYRAPAGRDTDSQASRHARELLLVRSRLETPEPVPPVPLPATRPDQGHATARAVIGFGRENGQQFAEIQLRPAYHDLLDPDEGYSAGAQIEFFALKLRQYENEVVKVENFTPIEIISLSPRDAFFSPISWKINLGWTRVQFPGSDRPLVFRLNGGSGLAWALPDSFDPKLTAYTLLEATLDLDNEFKEDYALGAGPALGVLADITAYWRIHAYAKTQRFALGDKHTVYDLHLDQRLALGKNTALRIDVARQREFDHYYNTARLSWQLYF